MNIIIAGAGRVGFQLARTLSVAHNVTVIDRNSEALKRLQESLDILPVHGDIEDPLTYRKLIEKEADIFIAVTDMDEANIISTLIAGDSIEIKRKFIRLRNEFFAKSSIREKLEISDAVFPLNLTSETVQMLFSYPRANNVKSFSYTDMKLISVRATGLSDNIKLKPEGCAVVGIERKNIFILPGKGEIEIESGDLVYFFGDESRIRQLCTMLETEAPDNIDKCVVFGAGDLGVAIARKLIEYGKEVKLIEKDLRKCEVADEMLDGEAMVLSCKYGTSTLFEEEGLIHADMMIAATENDEYNIIKCLEAKEYGIKKVIAINNEIEYYSLMHSLGIVVVRGPKMSAFHTITEKIHSSRIVTERKYCGGMGSLFLRKIFPGSHMAGRRLKPREKRDSVKMFYIRKGELFDFDETIYIEEEDILAVFMKESEAEMMESWLNGL